MSLRIENKIAQVWRDCDAILWWNGEWWRARKLFDLADKAERVLKKAGFGKGSRAAVLMTNCPALLALSMACWRLAGTVITLNHGSKADDLAPVLGQSLPSVVFYGQEDGEKIQEALKKTDFPGYPIPQDDFIDEIADLIQPEPSSPDVALMFATSGTTGRPKVVPLTHSNILSDVDQALRKVSIIEKKDVFLNVLPNFHTLGFVVSGILPLLIGAGQAIMPHFMPPERVLDCMDSASVTVVVAVPTMLYLMVASAAKNKRTFQSVKAVITGGDRFPSKLDKRVQAVFGVSALEGYGLTECSPILAVNPNYEKRRPGTVGPILDDIAWQIKDTDGKVLGPGETGILWVKGPSVACEYFRDLENTEKRFADGWFNTGDVVSLDEDGYVSIKERVTDVIIVGGFNVYPQEVENVLMSHPGVQEAAVVGKSNDLSGQLPFGYVILSQGAKVSQGELVSYCKERLAHYKVPRRIEFVQDLPKNALGKVLRRALREKLNSPDS